MPDSVLFDRYELIEPAGSGGSAEVWRARDRTTGDVVAVKRLHPVVFGDAAARRRLEREFHVLERIDEPHVVRVRDLRIGDREAVLVLDFVAGPTLRDRLAELRERGERLPLDAGVGIVADVAAALAAAHAAGLVHRDVTPANVLLGPDGQARLTDFGIAHSTGEATATALTAPGFVLGTMRYLAPEQLRGEPATPAGDLYGLAAIAYEIAAGRPAYEATTPVALVEAQRSGPAPIEGVPPAVDEVIRRGLDADPARRPADVGVFATELAGAAGALAGPDDPTVAIPLATPAATPAEEVAVASPARAALAGLGGAVAVGPSGGRSGSGGGVSSPPRTLGAPVAAALALVLGIVVLAAAAGTDRSGEPAASAGPGATAAPASRIPAPTDAPKPAGNRNGNGHGGGKGHDEGKGHG